MFYLQELLTERKHGIAIIWLLATIGSKSEVYRIRRKEIQSVNVSRACDNLATLGEQVPFALRLQSNLLLGITRVYALQARYFFQEVTSASTQMQKSTMTTFASNTLKVGATAPSHALVLAEDPNFHLHFNALDVLGDFIISHDPDSGYSDLSVTSSPRKARAERRNTPLGVVREVDYTVEWDRGVSPHHQFQEGGDQIEDVGFEFDPDGRMYDTDTNAPSDFTGLGGAMSGGVSVSEMSVLSPKRIGSFPPLPVGEAALPDEFQLELPQQEDEMANFQNGKFVVISEFNSFFAGFTQRYANTTHDCDCEPFIERDEREQPPVQKKTRTYYPAADERTDVRNADLRDWQYNYLNEMARVLQLDTLNARKRKQDVSVIESLFTLGNRPLGPDLHMFTGSALLGSNGIASQPATATQPSNTAPEESRQSSPRTPTAARSPPVPYSAEVGRDAPYTGLVDISGMGVGALGQDTPWSGLRSGTPSIGGPGSAAFGGFSSIAGSVLGSRRGSRAGSVLSASRRAKWPGMGDVSGGLMEGVEHEQDTLRDDEYLLDMTNPLGLPDMPALPLSTGPAHDREVSSFYEYVKLQVASQDNSGATTIAFESLFPPDTSKKVVGASAFYLVLRLASNGMMRVAQDESYGEITVGIKEQV